MLRPVPNMSPAETCLGIWSTVLAEYRFPLPSAWISTRLYSWPARLWTFGLPMYIATASRP